jgi:hypothetical protein
MDDEELIELIEEEDDTDYNFEHPDITDYNGFITFGETLYE